MQCIFLIALLAHSIVSPASTDIMHAHCTKI